MSNTFKAGDKVRRTEDHGIFKEIRVGYEFVVDRVTPAGNVIEKVDGRRDRYHETERLELVVEEPKAHVPQVGDKYRLTGSGWGGGTDGFTRGDIVVIDNVTTSGRARFKSWNIIPGSAQWDGEYVPEERTEVEVYNESLFPLFLKLAEEANNRGYCPQYDSLAAIVGAPSRAELIAERDRRKPRPNGLEQFQALEVGQAFTVTFAGQSTHQVGIRVKISDERYTFVRNGQSCVYRAKVGLNASDTITAI